MPVRLMGILVIGAAAVGLLYWQQGQHPPLVVSGVIEADEIRVGSRVGGRVREVLVAEGAPVSAGQVLVRLEPYDLNQRLAEAQAQLMAAIARQEKRQAGFRLEEIAQAQALRDQAKAAYDEAVAGPRRPEIEEARASLQFALAELELAQIELKRAEALFSKKSVSREVYDQELSRRKVAQATVDARRERLGMLNEGTRKEQIDQAKAKLAAQQAELELRTNGFRTEDVAEAKAQAEATRAAVEIIRQQIAELEVRAPLASAVEALELQPGDLISANAPVISLLDTRRLWVRVYVPEIHLVRVPPGRRLAVTVDGFPDRTFPGRVSFVARRGEFTPNNVQTPEERGRQVFRVRIELEDGLDLLRPGMAADVALDREF